MPDLEALAGQLAAMIGGLQQHIEARAVEIAEPRIRHAEQQIRTADAEWSSAHAAAMQRKDDLIAELRRQLNAAVKFRGREFDELKRLRAAVHRVRHEVRCWPNEDGKWFAFRDELYAALDGEEGPS